MRIVILGAGRVGESVAESLVSERNDITLIDPDAQRLRELEERLDLRGVVGNGIHPSTLERAGIRDADMLIACATQDETNLVACKIAHDRFGVPSTVARLRSAEFVDGGPLLQETGFAVDHVICPEESVVRYIQKLIDYPEALQVLEFARGRAHLIAVRAVAGSAIVNRSIAEFRARFPHAPMRVVAVYRQEAQVTCEGSTRILPGDEVFLLADQEHHRAVLEAIHDADQPVRRVMIAGGGNVGLRLARRLVGHCEVKLIERDPKRCEYLATELPSELLVLQGDGTDEELLADENVGSMDMFLALTSDDEDNILSAMLAKRLGARRVLSLINRRAYADLMQGSTIDIAVSPAHTVIGELLAHVRRGDVVAVHSLRRGAAEALEGVAHGDAKTSRLVGRTVAHIDRTLPDGVRLGAVVRGEGERQRVLMPGHDLVIETDDHLILFIPNKRQVREVERLFQVSATFF
ncbi:Trk system potassium transporter TrkA [Ramlibacter tataouinensis]|uniref:Trk system potassium uptake protein TrkA n=1 Tax=Ramlibacter tataouinensis (strain ATCC BAA-407 / DSM 14655 / LMG 21543 / TTB310) TaxID=365046 RepID=F5XW80_RAMTT|nr:Trk system potassium transporter TrkA [Ramlibacter tataouinensis]AEG91650.1 Candidate NAD binding component of K+ transport system [Ramlibacter tataouinensis TTB310]